MQSESNSSMPKLVLASLILISMCGPLGMNIILPSISTFRAVFDTDYGTAQLTLTLYLASVAFAQLIYGPVSDRFGRVPIVFFGLATYLGGGLLCLFSTSIEMLLVGRVIQAFGGCAGMVMGRAMVRDRYDAEAATSVIAYMTMAIVLAPTLGPAIGGILEDVFGWQSVFVFVIAFGIVVTLIVMRNLEETLPPKKRHATHFSAMLLSFGYLLRNRTFVGYALLVAFSTSAYFAFLGGSSYVMIDLMGWTATELGLVFVVVSALYILGNFLTARLNKKFGIDRLIIFGALVSLTSAVAILVVSEMDALSPVVFTLLMSCIAFGNGFCISTGLASAIGADPARVGAASGLAGSMQVGFGAISTFVVGQLFAVYAGTPTPLILVVISCCFLAFVSFLFGISKSKAA